MSYFYNKEGFESITNAVQDKMLEPKMGSSATNTDNLTTKIRINHTTQWDDNFFCINASTPTLHDGQTLKCQLLSEDNTLISSDVFVTNDKTYKSACIPLSKIQKYINTILYIVPAGVNSNINAYAAFMVHAPKDYVPPVEPPVLPAPTPAVINPEVELSDIGYDAMALNKQSNMLNDIQKIVHNEMLLHRATDVSVKNPACKKKKNSSSRGCDAMETSPDMSKYIKKDEIPCWGCSIDY